MRDRGGYVWYVRKALEKSFSDMYGSWHGGVGALKKKLPEAERPRVKDFQPISSRHGQNFDPFDVIFSGFRRLTPLKP